eukprot:jgi/Mesvir1/7915/Mv11840-RA.1
MVWNEVPGERIPFTCPALAGSGGRASIPSERYTKRISLPQPSAERPFPPPAHIEMWDEHNFDAVDRDSIGSCSTSSSLDEQYFSFDLDEELRSPREASLDSGDADRLRVPNERARLRSSFEQHLLTTFCTCDFFSQKLRADATGILAAYLPMAGDSASNEAVIRHLAQELKFCGYDVQLRTSSSSCLCLGNGHHTFAEVEIPGCSGERGPLIVDTGLREQFQVARPTPEYSALLLGVPGLFVGDRKTLKACVAFMINRMRECLKVQGMAVAPWRSRHAFLAKWLLASCQCAQALRDRSVVHATARSGDDQHTRNKLACSFFYSSKYRGKAGWSLEYGPTQPAVAHYPPA